MAPALRARWAATRLVATLLGCLHPQPAAYPLGRPCLRLALGLPRRTRLRRPLYRAVRISGTLASRHCRTQRQIRSAAARMFPAALARPLQAGAPATRSTHGLTRASATVSTRRRSCRPGTRRRSCRSQAWTRTPRASKSCVGRTTSAALACCRPPRLPRVPRLTLAGGTFNCPTISRGERARRPRRRQRLHSWRQRRHGRRHPRHPGCLHPRHHGRLHPPCQ